MSDKTDLEVVTVTELTISWKCPDCHTYWDEEQSAVGQEVTCKDCNKSFLLKGGNWA